MAAPEAKGGSQSLIMSAGRWWRGGDRVECDEDRSRKAWVDRGVRGGQGRHSRLLRRGARLAGRDPRFEDGVKRRRPSVRIDGVGKRIPCERGATLEEFLEGDVVRRLEAGVGEELCAIAGRWQGDLGSFTIIREL